MDEARGAGRLVAPFGGAVQDGFAYYLVATEARFASAKVRRFLEWFTGIAEQWPGPDVPRLH